MISRRPPLLAVGFLIACGTFALLPFGWMILTSLRTQRDLNSGTWFPGTFTLDNFVRVTEQVPVLHYFSNSVVVTGVILLAQLLTSIPAGYALARRRSDRSSRAIVWVVLAATMVPTQVVALPLFLALSRAHLVNSLAGLIIPFLASAFGIYLFRQFFLQFPEELIEAARLDGASEARTLLTVVVPLARPTIIAFSIFSVTAHWNDYFWPYFTLRGDEAATIPFAVAQFAANESGTDYPLQMAAAVMAVAPMAIAFLFLQRHFRASVLTGAGK